MISFSLDVEWGEVVVSSCGRLGGIEQEMGAENYNLSGGKRNNNKNAQFYFLL